MKIELGIRTGKTIGQRFISAVSVISLFFIVCSGFSCSTDEEPAGKKPATEEQPKQYDVPFSNVPATSSISMYEVNMRVFSSSGTLNGVKARLDEIKALGINVIWLMPIHPTGVEKGIGSPYAVRNYTEVDPEFGTLEDLRSLVKEAHARDMAVIMDWVANHTAWDNPWIKNPTWYTRDGSGNIVSPPGMGWNDVADLNFSSQPMRREMIKAMKYWILEGNVDGYRCDYAEGVPNDFWKQAIDTLRSIPNRDIIMFAEAGKKDLFSAGFDMIFGWNFYHKLKDVYNINAAATTLASAHSADYTSVPEGKHILRWITNHDDNAWDNTPVNIFKGQAGAVGAFIITAYMGGVPLIYNGQEVGYPNQLPFFANSTIKIDWNVNPEIYLTYKKIMALRNTSTALKTGSLEAFSTNDVTVFKRISGEEEILVLVNVRGVEKSFTLPVSLAGTSWTNAFSNEAIDLDNTVDLAPYGYLVLKN